MRERADTTEYGGKLSPAALSGRICACGRCRPSIVVKIDDSFSQSGTADAFVVPWAACGEAYEGRGDGNNVHAQLFNNADILKSDFNLCKLVPCLATFRVGIAGEEIGRDVVSRRDVWNR